MKINKIYRLTATAGTKFCQFCIKILNLKLLNNLKLITAGFKTNNFTLINYHIYFIKNTLKANTLKFAM